MIELPGGLICKKMKSQCRKPVITLLFLLYAALLPLIISNYNAGRAFYDQQKYHFPTIVHFSDNFDVAHYSSATTPGYHYILSIVYKTVSSSEVILKLVSSGFTALFFILGAGMVGSKLNTIKTIATCLPALTSIYIYPSGVWLIPDNLSWLLILAVLFLMMNSSVDFQWLLLCSMLFSISILVRQTNIWLALPIVVTVMLKSPYFQNNRTKQYIIKSLRSLMVIFPGTILLVIFFFIWGGWVPPDFQTIHQGINLAVPAFFFAVFFSISIFYIPYIADSLKLRLKNKVTQYCIIAAFIIGCIVSIIPETRWSMDDGRVSGLWNLVRISPVYHGRSVLLAIMAPLGAVILGIFILLLKGRNNKIILAIAILSFISGQTLQHFAYERYYWGFIFIIMLVFLYHIRLSGDQRMNFYQVLSPCILAVINAIILVRKLL